MKEDFLEEMPQGRRPGGISVWGRGGEKGTPREEMSKARQPGPEGLVYLGTWLPMTGPDEQERVPAC